MHLAHGETVRLEPGLHHYGGGKIIAVGARREPHFRAGAMLYVHDANGIDHQAWLLLGQQGREPFRRDAGKIGGELQRH